MKSNSPASRGELRRPANALERLCGAMDTALRTLAAQGPASRPVPGPPAEAIELSHGEARRVGELLRVDHVGEVCAQALYEGQALTCRTESVRRHLLAAAREEADHLAWTRERLEELGDRTSLLNPFWYAGSFALGAIAGRIGDGVSLGFVDETERQVEAHLAGHLDALPARFAELPQGSLHLRSIDLDGGNHVSASPSAAPPRRPRVLCARRLPGHACGPSSRAR